MNELLCVNTGIAMKFKNKKASFYGASLLRRQIFKSELAF